MKNQTDYMTTKIEKCYTWHGKNIVLVEQGNSYQKLIEKLEETQASFIKYSSTEDTEYSIKNRYVKPDLLIIETSLLKVGTNPLLYQLKKLSKEVPVFATYHMYSSVLFNELRRCGVSEFIKQPLNFEILLFVIDVYFNGEFNIIQF